MNTLDVMLLLLIVGVGVAGMVRGFGRTALDALALYAGLWAASLAAPLVAARISLHAGGTGINQSWAFAVRFLVGGTLLLGVSWYVYGLTQFDAGMFDKLLGLAAGLSGGVILSHVVVSALVIGDPRCIAAAAPVSTGTVGCELYSFSGYHAVMDAITGSKTYLHNTSDPSVVAGR